MVPDEIWNKKAKSGLNGSGDVWFRNGFKSLLMDTRKSYEVKDKGRYDFQAVDKLISEHISGKKLYNVPLEIYEFDTLV